MKKLNVLALLVTIFFLILNVGCKKDNEETQPENQQAKEFNVKTVTIPDAMAQSNEPGAQQSKAFINLMNSMAGYGSMMAPPTKSSKLNLKEGGVEVYTWEFNEGTDNYSVTLKITETSTYLKWEMIISGILDGQQLNNFTYLMAEEYKDGSSSNFTVYDFDNPGSILMTMNWYESDGRTYFTFEAPQDFKMTMEAHADGSGMLEVYEWRDGQYVLDFKAEWDASGHGECWEYSNGELVDHTSW